MDPNQTPQENLEHSQVCKFCKKTIPQEVYFCPNCGKKLKNPPPSTSISSQVKIYLICIFVPPFGLIPSIKYMIYKDNKTRAIGVIGLVLTAFSIYATYIFASKVYNSTMQQFNDLQFLGY